MFKTKNQKRIEEELLHLRNEYKKALHDIELIRKGLLKMSEFYIDMGKVVHIHTDMITKMNTRNQLAKEAEDRYAIDYRA